MSNLTLKSFDNTGVIVRLSDLDRNFATILEAIQGIANTTYGTLWYDSGVSPPVYYIRDQNNGTTSFEALDGTPVTLSTQVIQRLHPVSSTSNIKTDVFTYIATSNGTNYQQEDILLNYIGVDIFSPTPTVAYSFWVNVGASVSTPTIMSLAPVIGQYSPLSGGSGNGSSINQIGGETLSLGQKTGANSIPVVLSSDQASLLAKENGGNLAIIANAQGSSGSGISQPNGGSGVLGWLSGIYNKTINRTWSLSSMTDTVTATLSPTDGGNLTTMVAKLTAIANLLTSPLPLQSDAATDTSLQQILSAIKASVDITSLVWFDPSSSTSVYYIRRETINEGTGLPNVTWEDINGASVTLTSNVINRLQAISNLQNVSSKSLVYTAIADGTGYLTGDILVHTFGIDTLTTPQSLLYSFWFNAGPSVANGSVLTSAPTSGTYAQATESVSIVGTPNVSVTNTPSVNLAQINGFALALGQQINDYCIPVVLSTQQLASLAQDRTTFAAPSSVRLSNGSSFIDPTQIRALTSADTVTVNNAFALETGGNLASVASGIGSTSDVSWGAGTNSGSIISILKYIGNSLLNTVFSILVKNKPVNVLQPVTTTTNGTYFTLIAANSNGVEFDFMNTSDTVMYITTTGTTPSATTGFPVNPNGGYYTTNGKRTTSAVQVYCSSASKTFYCEYW